MQSSSAKYIPRLDHLRFVAALLVFGWHSMHLNGVFPFEYAPKQFFLSIFEEGHTGVSLFLTLSGFIFANLCYGRDVTYWAFLRNRWLRVGPLLLVWTLLNYQLYRPAAEHLLPILVGLQNQEFPGPGWTVVVEFQLYFAFPFFLKFSERFGSKYLVGVLLVALVLRGTAWIVTRNIQYVAYWTVLGRVDEFVCGMIAFRASTRFGKILGKPLVFLAILTLWLYIYDWFNRLGGYYFSATKPVGSALWIYFPTLEGIFYGALTVSYLNLPFRGVPILGRAAAWLGSVSYSIYLAHSSIAQAAFGLAATFGVPLKTQVNVVLFAYLAVLPVVVACAALTYYVVELPFLRMRRPYLQDLPGSVRPAGE